MKTVDQVVWLAGLEQQVESYIQQAIQTFQNLDEDTLQTPSATGGWSVSQCLAHLNSYGQYYLPRLKGELDQLPNNVSAKLFVGSWLGAYLTRLMDPNTGKLKLKAAKRHQPIDSLLAYRVVAEFIDQQEELLGLLRNAKQKDLNTVRIPLSVAPWIRVPLGDLLAFMVVHTERHIIQAKRNVPVG